MSDNANEDAIAGALPGSMGQGPRAGFFPEPAMDRFMAVLLNMASEMWVMEERLRALEPDGAGGDPAPDAAAFVSRLFAPMREPR